MFLFFLVGGLFLGWFIGSRDAFNLYGNAISSRIVNIIWFLVFICFFLVIGAVSQGKATTNTISNLGLIDSPIASFIIALAAGLTVYVAERLNYHFSIIQSLVGAIIGWNLFAGNLGSLKPLSLIFLVWLIAPLIGGIFSALFYLFVKRLLKRLKIHIIILNVYLRYTIIILSAILGFYFGANNIASIVGAFKNIAPEVQLNFDILQISGEQILYFLGSLMIIVGIFSNKKLYSNDQGDDYQMMQPETSVVLILAQISVLVIFTSQGFSNLLVSIGLFAIPLVPISISHVATGSLIGIGVVKGGHEINIKKVISMIFGIFLTVAFALMISFILLLIAKNVFNISGLGSVHGSIENTNSLQINSIHEFIGVNILWYLLIIVLFGIIGIITIYFNKQRRVWQYTMSRLNHERKEHNEALQALTEANLKTIIIENSSLNDKLEYKHKELIYYALNIVEQREYLVFIHNKLKEIQKHQDQAELQNKINELLINVRQKMASTEKVDAFYVKIEQLHQNFTKRLIDRYPDLSEKEQNLIKLLRLGFSSKEIAPLLNISPKSVEISRYRLRKKLQLEKDDNLIKFINNI